MGAGRLGVGTSLGAGIPYLKGAHKAKLKLAGHKPFDNGVVRLHYVKEIA